MNLNKIDIKGGEYWVDSNNWIISVTRHKNQEYWLNKFPCCLKQEMINLIVTKFSSKHFESRSDFLFEAFVWGGRDGDDNNEIEFKKWKLVYELCLLIEKI